MEECFFCKKPLVGAYYSDAWGHKVCRSHIDGNEIVLCSSCGGFAEKNNTLLDGRTLCSACAGTAIKVGDNIDPISNFVLKNLGKVGFDDLRVDNVTVKIASAVEIGRIRGAEPTINVRGLAKSQVMSSVGGVLFGRKPSMNHTIYMLEHQPKAQFAGTLAHELLHAWQVQNGIQPPPPQCEGFCNLAAYYIFSISPTSLSKVLMQNMMKSPDPVYGDGFRAVWAKYEELGWSGVIDLYRQNRY